MIKIGDPKKRLALRTADWLLRICFLPFRVMSTSSPSFNRILLIRLDHIGDVSMITSIPRIMKKQYPGSYITVMVGSWTRDLIKYNPYIDKIVCHDVPWWSSVRPGHKANNLFKYIFTCYIPILKKLRNDKFDLGIDFRGDLRQIFLFLFLPGVKYKISHDRSGGKCLLNHAESYDENKHETQKNIALLSRLGIKEKNLKSDIPITDRERSYINSILKSKGVKEKDLKIALSPGARVKVKRWPLKNFIKLGRLLVEKYNARIIFTGTSKEANIKQIPDSEGFINLIDKTSLLELTALFEKADLLISNDSGVTHIASSRDLPMITLFGPTDPAIYKPAYGKIAVIKKDFSCSPCLHKICAMYKTDHGKCLEQITIDEVMQKTSEFL